MENGFRQSKPGTAKQWVNKQYCSYLQKIIFNFIFLLQDLD